jgi:hypothetical protein
MGTSCLTGTIYCQTRKENPAQTLSDFDPDSYVVHPNAGDSLQIVSGSRIITGLFVWNWTDLGWLSVKR